MLRMLFLQLCAVFPVNIRFTAVGIAYNASQAIFGGSIPVIATQLAGVSPTTPAFYVT